MKKHLDFAVRRNYSGEEDFLRDLVRYECPPGLACPAEKLGLCSFRKNQHEKFGSCASIDEQVTLVHARGKLVLDKVSRDILLSRIQAYIDSEGEHDFTAQQFMERILKVEYK